jgi:hypothetical protein
MAGEKFRFATEIETQTGNVKSIVYTVSVREPDSDYFHNQKYKFLALKIINGRRKVSIHYRN